MTKALLTPPSNLGFRDWPQEEKEMGRGVESESLPAGQGKGKFILS